MIEAKGVSKYFGRRKVLQGLDIKVGQGEISALMGPNGSGKTTLLKIVAGLLQPSSGDVFLGGRSIFDDEMAARRSVGLVGHSAYTYEDLTSLENLKFYWLMNGLPSRDFEQAGQAMLRRVGLAHRMNDRVAVFSKGMGQRLAIARALIHSPKILLLDEPFSSLDQKGVDILSQVLKEERSKGASILMVTHDIRRISELADRAEILSGGKIVQSFDSNAIRSGELEKSYRASSEVGIL